MLNLAQAVYLLETCLSLWILLMSHAHGQGNIENFPPVFDVDEVDFSVPENFNTSSYMKINPTDPITATDTDGDNITYYIPDGGLGSDKFSIESVYEGTSFNGYIYFNSGVALDREHEHELQLLVQATDGLNHGSAQDPSLDVTVRLVDVNDNSPTFNNLPEVISVLEDKDTNAVIFTVSASDADSGKNKQIGYSIIASNPPSGLQKFGVNAYSGEIHLLQTVDFEGIQQYILTVQAQDKGDIPLANVGLLTVNIKDVNDENPVFDQSFYETSVVENATKGEAVLTVSASDGDKGINDPIILSFNSSVPKIDGVPSFAIDPSSGVITVKSASLDREQFATYTLTVLATEMSDPTRTSQTSVVIRVLDINDNRPVFEQPSYNASISETADIGTTVLQVTASDDDINQNAFFLYELYNVDSSFVGVLPFNISSNGLVTVAISLDYESVTSYKFEVHAVETEMIVTPDPGSGWAGSAMDTKIAVTIVSVEVINKNDNAPIFLNASYASTISEELPSGEFVVEVEAVDNDASPFGDVTYSLLNSMGKFFINETTGIIRTNATLDYEVDKFLSFSVMASDSEMTQQVAVYVTVANINDNSPMISVNGSTDVTEVTQTVEEAQSTGQLVFVVEATDADDDNLNYGIVSQSPNTSSFHFQFKTDEPKQLVTSLPLDYEMIQTYTLILSASDGVLSDTVLVIINVVDENDNSPIFVNDTTAYAFSVFENLAPGAMVGKVEASDKDSDLFGTVRYNISGVGYENFTVDAMTGVITTAITLDRETKEVYNLVIKAYDLDPNSPRSNTADLSITVLDENDNTPMFSAPIYQEEVVENTAVVSIVVAAMDKDIGDNGKIEYSIVDGNSGQTFIIGDDTGIISRNPLVDIDREVWDQFKLTVVAVDNGIPQKSSNATVLIEIQDLNDNTPMFGSSSFTINITEDFNIGTLVFNAVAVDDDYGSNGEVTYTLLSEDEMSLSHFMLESSDSGAITTSDTFDYDMGQTSFGMIIRAEDNGASPKTGETILTVIILDVNDNSPVFEKVPYIISVAENMSPGSSIMTVVANDADSGLNQDIMYSIVQATVTDLSSLSNGDDASETFLLGDMNGTLYLTSMLDYEMIKGYTIVIRGVDGGVLPQSGTTTVLISVTDFNDNDPEFMEGFYEITLSESSAIGTTSSILVDEVTDMDSGSNAAIGYSVEGTTVFTINEKGVLQLDMLLDHESVSYFEFMVIATDMGSIPRNSSVFVNVTVTDSNDNSPIFQFPAGPGFTLSLNISEGNYSTVNHLLTTVNATDLDSGSLGNVQYSITSGNDESIFLINSISGNLYVIGALNREAKSSYSLTITAKDQGVPPRTDTATVSVTVLDINEVAPTFQQTSYSAVVPENTLSGYPLVTVSATDSDLAENGTFTFSLSDYTYLSINHLTGAITTNTTYDYETMKNLSTTVIVSDNGPTRLTSTVPFVVYVSDVNDNPPVFSKDNYGPFTYAEDTEFGTTIASVSASDVDSGANGDFTYTLANGQGKFQINSTGDITVSSSLDRETTHFYALVITATDHGSFIRLSSTANLNVSVSDINDNAPVFATNMYSISEFPENSTVNSLVTTVNATDVDLGENSVIQFSIVSGDSGNQFRIETDVMDSVYVGSVYVNQVLDYEQVTSYFMSIKAQDQGTVPKETTVSFSVLVKNINDNYPVFSADPYTFEISENAVVSSPVGTIVASDNDAGLFGMIVAYSFPLDVSDDVNNTFSVSPTTGVITLTASLDYDIGPTAFSFSVVAVDGGGLESTASVTVSVINTNEFQPVFGASLYNGSVLENLDPPQSITTVKATEGDAGNPGIIEYKIIEGDPNGHFTIDASTGNITTTTALDREEQEVYVLRIEAKDQGVPPQSGFTQVKVTVLDANDNSPNFSIPSGLYEYQISEDTVVPAMLSPVVLATDLDIGSNGMITYSLSDVSGVFSVNSNTGVIYLNSELDRETKQNYTLVMTAVDGGSPSNPTNLTIVVFVVDSNDKAPVFTQESYATTISENTPQGSFLIETLAVDADVGSNSEVFYQIFDIKGVALSESPFVITNAGSLLTSSVNLDYEIMSYYEVTVAATDSGVPAQTSYAQVNISVEDINDHFPAFQQSPYTVSKKEGNVGPTTVLLLQVVADDNDGTSPNNVVKYAITAGNEENVFSIDSASGNLFAVELLDYEMKNSYILTVTATDQPTDSTTALSNSTQVMISLIDINDNAPVFQPSIYSVAEDMYAGYILENATVGTEILSVLATDEDSGSLGKVTYSFIAPSSKFFINQTSGVIYVIGTLDSEGISEYNLTVIAMDQDQNDPPLINQATVTIEVIGINDNAPKFVSSIYYSTIPEESAPDFLVLNLIAIDLDSDDIVYTITDGNEMDYFKINTSSGAVTVKNPPDREVSEIYTLTVAANDGMQSVSTMLQITVTDINDNAPTFVEDHYYTFIVENVVGGAPVLVYNAVNGNATLIEAIDADKANTLNSKVVYKTAGVNKDILSIDPSTGVLTVSSGTVFNYETNQTIDVTIVGTDSASQLNAMSSTVLLTIHLQDVNDVNPQFDAPTYAVTISEGTPSGTIVPANIMATDDDTGLGGVVSYFITQAAPLLYLEEFEMNQTTGVVTLTGSLDRETAEMIELIVTARDSITPFLSTTVQLIITVSDVNDNAPNFDNEYYFIEVPEDLIVGEEVMTITASDQDSASNAQVVYSILQSGDKFKINQGTGLISTLVELDHETEPLLEIVIQACDMGSSKMCSNATIEVTVTDVNDGIPTFDFSTYFSSVCNDTYPVVSIMRPIAWDTDSGSNGVVGYTLSGNTGGLFSIVSSTGEVELITSILASDIGQTYIFDIVATDNGSPSQSSVASVEVTICDETLAPIKFNQTSYFVAISENEAAPTFLLTVVANALFSPITYSILTSDVFLPFNITSSTGNLFATETLDSETRNLYSLVVQAQDNATVPNIAHTMVIIAVINVNDNPPKFLLAPYFFTTTEGQTPPVEIDTTVAIDPDVASGESNITYKIVSSSDPSNVFSIGAKDGVIVANQRLDRETQEVYVLMIEAKDSDAYDPRTATATATIVVVDINDNSPTFDESVYTVSISENQPPNSVVESTKATDIDLGENSVVLFSIIVGDINTFFIDPNTGTITILTSLDYEMETFYNLTVLAVDNGFPPLNATAVVEIMVEDYNDCIPQFTKVQYTAERFENSTTGTVIGNFSDTSDCDSGSNGELTFSILTGNEDGLFMMGETTGILTLVGVLDHETKNTFLLKVQSKDKGVPSLSNSVLLTLAVLDVNDETPMFDSETYNVEISEATSSQFPVLQVTATDNDATTNGQLLYSIESGNEANDFSIDESSGTIAVAASSLDRETYDSYFLIVVATDKGVPARSANATVSITLTDVNDNPPIITNLPHIASLKENVSDYVIYNVNATDADIGNNQELIFSLNKYTTLFSIDSSSGQVSRLTTVTLDYEQTESYDLPITVRDNGQPLMFITHGTLTVEIIDIDDNPPVFTQAVYEEQILENLPAGTTVATVSTTDEDTFIANTRAYYNIIDCNACGNMSIFEIDSVTGIITTTTSLNRETIPQYVLTVAAVNADSDYQLSSTCMVIVTVIDVNDETPQFNQTLYKNNISERASNQTYILTVFATDGDEAMNPNSKVTYGHAAIKNNPFILDNTTGVLALFGELDRENVPVYTFNVIVTDEGIPNKLSSTAKVTITVDDENDNGPFFVNGDITSKKIEEDEKASAFPQLLANLDYSDRDIGSNNDSVYHILAVLNGTEVISDDSLISLGEQNGSSISLWLNAPLDYETTKEINVSVRVENTQPAHPSLCSGGNGECYFSDNKVVLISVVDANDNPPVFLKSSYSGQISTETPTGTIVLNVTASDMDTGSFGTVNYRIVEGSSAKFRIDETTGHIITRGTFDNDDEVTFDIEVVAYDNFGNNPSFSSTVSVSLLALKDFRRVLIVFGLPISAFTEEKIRLITEILQNMTGYQIVVEEIREHVLDASGDVDPSKTDLIFHALDPSNNEIVDFDTFIANLDEELFFDAVQECRPETIISLLDEFASPPLDSIMIFLIILCSILALGAMFTLFIAFQQRYIALHDKRKELIADVFYGSPSSSLALDGIPRDMSALEAFEMKGAAVKHSEMYVRPYEAFGGLDTSGLSSSVGELSSIHEDNPLYEEQEIRMEMFQGSDNETEGEFDEAQLLAAALQDDDDEDEDNSTTAI